VSTAGNTQQAWNCNGGVVSSVTDQNGNPTSFGYDLMWRLASTKYPDDTTNDVDTISYGSSAAGFYVSYTRALTATTSVWKTVTFDGFMKPVLVKSQDPNNVNSYCNGSADGSGFSCVHTVYDALGRVSSVENPNYGTGDPTYGLTQYQYDALGRATLITNPDNSTITTKFNGSDTHSYGLASLNVYTEQDAAGRVVASCDGVGETATMANNDTTKSCGLTYYYSVSGFPSTYNYYPSGDMYSTYFAGSGTAEEKSYAFDVAGRVTSQTLPESGTESWTFDSPIPGQMSTYKDARNITTTYNVDNMYRPTSITFSDGTPTISNAYDLTTQTNGIGRLSTTSTNNTISGFNYDKMGRMNLKGVQAPLLFGNGNTTIGYGFDFAGNLTSLADSASNNTLTCSRNSIGQLTGITASYAGTGGDIVPTVLAGNSQQPFVYNALGLPTALSGASWPRTRTYDRMGRLTSIGDTGLEPYTLSIGRDADGKVTSVNDQVLGQWTYGYDNYFTGGRLTSATCVTGNGTCADGYGATSWTYDEYGNRWTQTAYKGLNTTFTYDTQSGGAMHNHIMGSNTSYDAAGDMLTDTIPNTYTYDALHRVKTASMNSSSFVYDGLGNRVEDANANGTFDWYYDGTSILHYDTSATTKGLGMKAGLGEYHGAPGAMRYYEDWRDQVGNLRQQQVVTSIGVGGVAEMENSQTYVSLPFGDSNLDTNQNGSEDTDLTSKFFFGDMMQIGGVNFSENRAQSVPIGRWLTPDPAHAGWNAYVYANNNPVTLSDQTGLDPDWAVWNFGGAPGVVGYYGGDFGCTVDEIECNDVRLGGAFGLLGGNAIASCPQCRNNPFTVVGADNNIYQYQPHGPVSIDGGWTIETGNGQWKKIGTESSWWATLSGSLVAGVARIRALAQRNIWEAANPGQKVPFDAIRGRYYDMAHKLALADGGTNAAENLKPQEHGEHMAEHMANGDFARWGSRAREALNTGAQETGDAIKQGFEDTVEAVKEGVTAAVENPGEAIKDAATAVVEAAESGEIPPP